MRDQDPDDQTNGTQSRKMPHPQQGEDGSAIPEANERQQDMSQPQTRLQRLKNHPVLKHPAFAPAAIIGGLLVGGGIVFAALVNEEDDHGSRVVSEERDSARIAFDRAGEGSDRKSPIQHSVEAHHRKQRYGPGRAETRTIPVSSYVRGGHGKQP